MAATIRPISSNRAPRLLPSLIDEIAFSDPSRIAFSYPLTLNPEDGFRDITFKELADIINRFSWWIEEKLGRSNSFETLTYVGPTDQTYIVLIFAAIKTGYKSPHVRDIVSKKNMTALTVSSIDDIMREAEVPLYPYTKSFDQARYEPFVALHTSGSTGLPKPIVLNHGTLAHSDLFVEIPKLGGKPISITRFIGERFFFGLPMFHSAAICILAFSIYSGATPVFSASFLPSAETVNKAHIHARVQGSLLIPSTIIELSRNPEYLDNMKRLKYLTFGGAPLPGEIGDVLKDYVDLFVTFGTTEIGIYALERIDSVDWEYASFSPVMGCELRPFSSGLFELVFVRQEKLQDFQGIFATFPTIEAYESKDLYSKHPTKEGLWLYEGRSDDKVIITNGFVLNPGRMEGILNAHPLIKSALICGTGRPHYTVLIEAKAPPKTAEERSALVMEIWPAIERANSSESPYARIDKDSVLFTGPEKPMARAGKGSVQRKKTVQLYSSELDEIYKGSARR
ncbi:MAG: hypothetical protein Q9157_003178 [Trypethelium eluteriae]